MLANSLGIHDLGLFIVSGLLLNITPGPDSLLIMSRSAAQGWRAGSAAALGIGAGTLVHVLAGALGLSALLAASATAFIVVKLLGAAYLVWLGLGMLWQRRPTPAAEAGTPLPRSAPLTLWAIFRQGLLTNVLNPKVALFFLAFVPQFISADAPHKGLAFVLLGLVFNVNGMLWCHALAWFTAGASRHVRVPAAWLALLNRGIGALFLAFGIRLALAEGR
ncbi:MAG TPA: LysE family translocator [Burkholderiaceae bacterium]|nr:LysE family translocator [Burkholderiaceae bacterium]